MLLLFLQRADEEERTRFDHLEKIRLQLVEEERAKLLREHAPKLVGHLPKVSTHTKNVHMIFHQ